MLKGFFSQPGKAHRIDRALMTGTGTMIAGILFGHKKLSDKIDKNMQQKQKTAAFAKELKAEIKQRNDEKKLDCPALDLSHEPTIKL